MDEYIEWLKKYCDNHATHPDRREVFKAGQQSRQAEIDELQKKIQLIEALRDDQFEKLWALTQAIEVARQGVDEDFDLFLNHLSNILKGQNNENPH